MTVKTKAVAGSTTPTGVTKRQTQKTGGLAGSTTPTGALATHRTTFQTLIGSLTSSAALRRTAGKNPGLAGSTTPTGVTKRLTTKKVGQGYTFPPGKIRNTIIKRMTGSVTASGATGTTDFGRVFGYPGIVVMNVIQNATLSIRHRRV